MIDPTWPARGTSPWDDALHAQLDVVVDEVNRKAGVPALRTAFTPLTAPNATLGNVLNHTQRSMVQFAVKPSRVRVGVANANLRSPSQTTTPINVTGMAYGSPVYTNDGDSRWRGDCTGPLTQIPGGSIAVPTDGTRGWSDWFEPDWEIAEDVVISLGLERPGASGAYATGNSYQAIWASGAANFAAQTLSAPQRITNPRMDIVVEYEYEAPAQVGLFVGDSNTVTYSPGTMPGVTGSYASAQPTEAWPQQAGMLGKFVAINMAVGSGTPEDFASEAPGTNGYTLWNRYDIPALGEIDFAVVSLGGNGISAGLEVLQGHLMSIIDLLRAKGVKRIYMTTLTPRGRPDGTYVSTAGEIVGSTLATPAIAGATEIQSSLNIPVGDGQVLIGDGPNLEEVTMTAVTGTGPYAVTLSAPLANDHLEGEALARDIERYRKYVNLWTRNVPYGIAGFIDFDRLLSHAPGHYMPDQRYISSDYLHFFRSSSAIKAQAVVAAGVAPSLVVG